MAHRAAELVAVQKPVSGVEKLDDRQAMFQRRTILALTVIPFAGVIAAVAWAWGNGLQIADVVAFGTLYAATGLGITVGYHRLFTHRSFDAPSPVRVAFAVAGSMALQGSVISWVANHRRHHAFADKEGDPHSPHLEEGEGIGSVLRGLWHAHVGWLFDDEKSAHARWAPDLLKDPAIVRVDRFFPLLALISFVLPAALGFALTGTVRGAFSALLWGGLVRVFLLHHVTWSVNSICHFYGRSPYETTDYSTNNWPLSIISFGESWHNTHHAFPTSAKHGVGWRQPDISAFVIALLEKLHLARSVKRVSPQDLIRKKRRQGVPT